MKIIFSLLALIAFSSPAFSQAVSGNGYETAPNGSVEYFTVTRTYAKNAVTVDYIYASGKRKTWTWLTSDMDTQGYYTVSNLNGTITGEGRCFNSNCYAEVQGYENGVHIEATSLLEFSGLSLLKATNQFFMNGALISTVVETY